jgi:hypothetical protein
MLQEGLQWYFPYYQTKLIALAKFTAEKYPLRNATPFFIL